MSEQVTGAAPQGRPRIQSLDEFRAEVLALGGPQVASKLGGRFVHEFVGLKPTRNWLLKGVLLASTFSLIVGCPGCGKSFLALDLAMTMSLAAVDEKAPKEWFGRRVKPCGVIYIAAEGQDDFIIRMHAWFHAKGLPVDTRLPMFLYPTAVDLRSSDVHTKTLIEEVKVVAAVMRAEFGCEPAMVVVDTFNRALAGGDDSKPEHVGALIKNCAKIREELKVAVVAVHHTAKNSGKQDPRGHGSIRGDNDAEIFVNPAEAGAPNDWRVARNKAGPTGDRHEFRLRPIEVGRDEDHDPITSCWVAPGAMEPSTEAHEMRDAADAAKTGKPTMTADGRAILPGKLTIVLRALHEAINAKGEYPPPTVRIPHGRKAVKYGPWLDEIVAKMPGDEKETKAFKERCRKARDDGAERLVNRGLIGMDGDWVWRTSKRVANIDLPDQDRNTAAPKAKREVTEEDFNVPF